MLIYNKIHSINNNRGLGKNINPYKMNWKRNFEHWQTITCNASSWRQLLAKLSDIIANIVTGNFFSLQLTDEKETIFQVHNYFFPRERERGRERKRTGETGGERPGEKFQTIACKTCAVISSVCRAPYVWFHSQLYNFIIREPRSRIVLGRFPIETLIERYRNLSFLCPSILNNSLIRFR